MFFGAVDLSIDKECHSTKLWLKKIIIVQNAITNAIAGNRGIKSEFHSQLINEQSSLTLSTLSILYLFAKKQNSFVTTFVFDIEVKKLKI